MLGTIGNMQLVIQNLVEKINMKQTVEEYFEDWKSRTFTWESLQAAKNELIIELNLLDKVDLNYLTTPFAFSTYSKDGKYLFVFMNNSRKDSFILIEFIFDGKNWFDDDESSLRKLE